MPPSVASTSTHYALVIDAGSSGSRLQIYSWRDPDLERAEIVEEVRASEASIAATLRGDDGQTSGGWPWVESSKAGGSRKWWWPTSYLPGVSSSSRKGKGKDMGYGELEKRALRRLVRVGKGVEGDDWVKRVEPGISTVDPTDIPTYLAPLLSHALQHIPPSQHARTPIYLYATAGMRLLPDPDQRAILKATCDTIRSDYPFRVGRPGSSGPCGENIRVISGEEEGLWGWVAVNYLMDGFGHAPPYDGITTAPSSTPSFLPLAPLAEAPSSSARDSVTPVDVAHHSPTFGFLDMGGASTQLAFSPTEFELSRSGYPNAELRKVSLRLLSGEEVDWEVFVASWLGFGTNRVRERYVDHLLDTWRDTSPADLTTPLPDPCLPVDLLVISSPDGTTPPLIGTGSFDTCLKTLKPLLDRTQDCPAKHCLFAGLPTPHIDFEREDQRGFIGVSEYWYTAHQVLGLGGVWDWGEWERGMGDFCARDWKEVEEEVEREKGWKGAQVELSRLQMQCFKGAWISNVLHEGIGIPRLIDQGGQETLTGGEIGETNAEAERRAREKGLLGESETGATRHPQGKPHFQSMDEIGSTAISWTLGKMVIEASKAVPPRSLAHESAWRQRLSTLGLGAVGSTFDKAGLSVVWAYFVLVGILALFGWSWIKRRRFPLSGSPRSSFIGGGGRRKRSMSSASPTMAMASTSSPTSWSFLSSTNSGEDISLEDGYPETSSLASRGRTIGTLRLWSLRLSGALRRHLPSWSHNTTAYDPLNPSSHPTSSSSRHPFNLSGRMGRHASMPLQVSSSNFSPSYASQPGSPRGGFFTPAYNHSNGNTSSNSNGDGSDGMTLSAPSLRSLSSSNSPEPRRSATTNIGTGYDYTYEDTGISSTSTPGSGAFTPIASTQTSPPRSKGRPLRARQNSYNSGYNGTGIGGATGGWNDPPSKMLGAGGAGSGLGSNSASSSMLDVPGSPVLNGLRDSGVLTPSASAGGSVPDRSLSRQSSRVNLSELGLNQRRRE